GAEKACAADEECATNHCVDGYCCTTACSGQCEACDADMAKGTCVPVAGSPHGTRPACAGASADHPCLEAICDGIVPDSCKGFVGADHACREKSCENGVETHAAVCDGKGACPAAETKKCEPFVCNAKACKTTCTDHSDCLLGYACDSGVCAP